MGLFIIILSFLLIMMSFVLLIISPFAVIGFVLGIAGIIYGRYYNKHSDEIKAVSKASFNQREQSSTEPIVRKFNFVEQIPVSGITPNDLKPFWSFSEEMNRSLATLYDCGEKIFRDNYSFNDAIVEVSGADVLVNGQPFGHLSPKALEKFQSYISEYPDARITMDAEYGYYAKIVRNPEYDREFDDDNERNMVEYDSLDKPRATLSIHYTMERSYS